MDREKHSQSDIEIISDDENFYNPKMDEGSKKKKQEVKPEQKKKMIKREIFSWIRLIVIAVVIALVINFLILFNGLVPSGSMIPTIDAHSQDDNARIIGFRLGYMFGEPERGDIIIFKYPDDPKQNFVKRVIGLPGDTVEIIAGEVYITRDGEEIASPLEEPYLNYSDPDSRSFGPYTVPEDSYFVMGDNRHSSHDSRFWNNTFVPRNNIIAKALFQYWPSFNNLTQKYY